MHFLNASSTPSISLAMTSPGFLLSRCTRGVLALKDSPRWLSFAAATARSCRRWSVFGTSLPFSTSPGSKSIVASPRTEATVSAIPCSRSIFASRGSGHSALSGCRKPVASATRRATSWKNFAGGRARSSCAVLFLFKDSSEMICCSTNSVPSTVSSQSSGAHSWSGRSSREAFGVSGGTTSAAPASSNSAPPAMDLSCSASGILATSPGTNATPFSTSSAAALTSSDAREESSALRACACCSMSCVILVTSSRVCS
mmetsp:Transcript_16209/g.48699  ORF Transcript_16209/g.48699 Transcript_16209/m.48699 type:complete len:257 (+) Transcript_16209:987-1757(+)